MLYVIRTSWSCSQAVSKPVWHIPLLCVQFKTPDDGQRNCPKHAEFYSKNKFEKLVHLVGFIIRIYHEAPSPERQKSGFCFSNKIKYLYLIINAICCFVKAGQLAIVTEIALHTHPNICCVSPHAPSSPAHTSTVYCPGTQCVHSAVQYMNDIEKGKRN
jgi:hypothetical protein